jgi:hypothetical protein
MTLDQIAERILLPARRSLTPEQRKLFTHERRVGHPKLAESILNLSFLVGVPHLFGFGF